MSRLTCDFTPPVPFAASSIQKLSSRLMPSVPKIGEERGRRRVLQHALDVLRRLDEQRHREIEVAPVAHLHGNLGIAARQV